MFNRKPIIYQFFLVSYTNPNAVTLIRVLEKVTELTISKIIATVIHYTHHHTFKLQTRAHIIHSNLWKNLNHRILRFLARVRIFMHAQ